MKLFHFSEESSIEIFKPRVKENRTDMPPVVWAIENIDIDCLPIHFNCLMRLLDTTSRPKQ
ncbi:DUF6886 family protein [Paenibacillus hemerocallicola]|uniref:DUF6886 family protein n=1 Tax=Paenibacillus hemerocallicola TaxID=1172614 RepID=UPI0026B08D0B